MSRQAGRRRRTPIPRSVSLTLLGALAALAVVAVAFAATQLNGTPPNAGELPEGSVVEPTAQPEPEPQEPEVVEEPAFASPAAQRILAASADPGHMLRAYVGACPDPAGSIEISFDSGATWQIGSLAGEDVSRILQFDASAPELDRAVVLNENCDVYVLRSFISGVDWDPEPVEEPSWFVDPSDANLVQTPTGAASQLPCNAVAFSSAASRAIVLCSDSTVTVSTDAGEQWSSPVAVPNGVSVGASSDAFLVASGAESECAGVRTRVFDGAALGEPGTCLEGEEGLNGEIAVAGGADSWFLWVGDRFARSGDQGVTWS